MLTCVISCTGFHAGGYLQVSEENLMTICSMEQMEEIWRNVVRLTRNEINQPLIDIDIDGIPSETDSSDEMDVFTPNADGMIRLEEVATKPPEGVNLTLVIGIKKLHWFFSMSNLGKDTNLDDN